MLLLLRPTHNINNSGKADTLKSSRTNKYAVSYICTAASNPLSLETICQDTVTSGEQLSVSKKPSCQLQKLTFAFECAPCRPNQNKQQYNGDETNYIHSFQEINTHNVAQKRDTKNSLVN